MADTLNLGFGFDWRETRRLSREFVTQSNTFRKMVPMLNTINNNFQDTKEAVLSINNTLKRITSVPLSLFGKGLTVIKNRWSEILDHSKEVEKRYTNLSNLFGSGRVGSNMMKWSRSVQTSLGVSASSLDSMIDRVSELGITLDKINIKGLYGSGSLTGGMDNSLSALVDLATGGSTLDFQRAFRNTFAFNDIANALEGAVTYQDRLTKGAEFLAKIYGGNVERNLNNIETSTKRITGLWDLFKDEVTDPSEKGGFMYEVRTVFKDVADYLETNRDRVIKIAKSIKQILGGAVRSLVKAFEPLTKRLKAYIEDSDKAIERFQVLANKAVFVLYLVGKKMAKAFEDPKAAVKGFIKFLGNEFKDGLVSLGKWLWGSIPTGGRVASMAIMGGMMGSIFGPVGSVIGAAFAAPLGLIDDWEEFFNRIQFRLDKLVAAGKVFYGTVTVDKAMIAKGIAEWDQATRNIKDSYMKEAIKNFDYEGSAQRSNAKLQNESIKWSNSLIAKYGFDKVYSDFGKLQKNAWFKSDVFSSKDLMSSNYNLTKNRWLNNPSIMAKINALSNENPKSRDEFFQNTYMRALGLGASNNEAAVIAAQHALESNWGKGNSQFGIMDFNSRRTDGATEMVNGVRKPLKYNYKKFNNLDEAIRGRIAFTKDNPRYGKAGYNPLSSPQEMISALQKAGYAEDRGYAEALKKLIDQYYKSPPEINLVVELDGKQISSSIKSSTINNNSRAGM